MKMKKILLMGAMVFLILVILVPSSMTATDAPANLKKYIRPAEITKLDWLLLKAEVNDFSKDIRWDDHGLIKGVSFFAINGRALVGMTFLVNKEQYIALSGDTTKKVFEDVVFLASNILMYSIPEVKDGANVFAGFGIIGGKIVAEFNDGQVTFKR
jgi:hypothetical protein